MTLEHPTLITYAGDTPVVADDAWVAPGVTLIGRVELRPRSSIWYTSVLRGDGDGIVIGEASNIQDGCVVHTDTGFPALIGAGVSVGHRAVLHGCTVEDDVLVGMGAVLLNGSHIGRGSLVAAGTVVLEGAEIPPGSLVAGVPGKVRRSLTAEELERVYENSRSYLRLMEQHRAATSALT